MHLTLTLYVESGDILQKIFFLRSIYSSFQDLIYTGPGKSLNGQKLEKIHLSITRAGPASNGKEYCNLGRNLHSSV